MSKQNIFDNEIFFEGYKEIRNRKDNANVLFEIPAFFSLLLDLSGKDIFMGNIVRLLLRKEPPRLSISIYLLKCFKQRTRKIVILQLNT